MFWKLAFAVQRTIRPCHPLTPHIGYTSPMKSCTHLKTYFTSPCYYSVMSFLLPHVCFICGRYLAAQSSVKSAKADHRCFQPFLVIWPQCWSSYLDLANTLFCHHCVVCLWPVLKNLPPFDGFLAGELNRITGTSNMGPVLFPQQHRTLTSIIVGPLFVSGTRINLMLRCVYGPQLCTN